MTFEIHAVGFEVIVRATVSWLVHWIGIDHVEGELHSFA